jgi:hypothetical protein
VWLRRGQAQQHLRPGGEADGVDQIVAGDGRRHVRLDFLVLGW